MICDAVLSSSLLTKVSTAVEGHSLESFGLPVRSYLFEGRRKGIERGSDQVLAQRKWDKISTTLSGLKGKASCPQTAQTDPVPLAGAGPAQSEKPAPGSPQQLSPWPRAETGLACALEGQHVGGQQTASLSSMAADGAIKGP